MSTGLGRVLIGGGTGFIGLNLVQAFQSIGSKVTIITRYPYGAGSVSWDQIRDNGLPGDFDVVINVAGLPMLNRKREWGSRFQQDILWSRVNTTHMLSNAVQQAAKPPKALITISGAGYYPPNDDDQAYDEYSIVPKNKNFFHRLCREMEDAAKLPDGHPTRQVSIRSGVVLSPIGGMIKEIYWPFYLGLGGPMGSGRQWFPWIHIHDLVSMFIFSAEDPSVTAILNGVAPEMITNEQFAKAFARAMWRPALFKMPEIVFKKMYGDEPATLITTGQKVYPKRPLELGFSYRYPTIREACKDLA